MEWTLRYIGGTSALLYTPLEDGSSIVLRDVPITVTSLREYKRLMRGKGWEDLTVYPKPKISASKAIVGADKEEAL